MNLHLCGCYVDFHLGEKLFFNTFILLKYKNG